jgi:hypothetical protein
MLAIIALLAGIVIGLIIGHRAKVGAVVTATHFYEKLYMERQAALAMKAETDAAYNNVKGKRNPQPRRIITPGDFDAHIGTSVNPRADRG